MNIAARTPLSHATNKPSGEKRARIAGSSRFPICRRAWPRKALGADLGLVQARALLAGGDATGAVALLSPVRARNPEDVDAAELYDEARAEVDRLNDR